MSAPTIADLERLDELRPKVGPPAWIHFGRWCWDNRHYIVESHSFSPHTTAAARKQLEDQARKMVLEGEHSCL